MTTTKPNFSSPWAFASGTSLQSTPRWWSNRQALRPLFLRLLDGNDWLHATESELWGYGVSNRHIAEFFCLVARYGADAVEREYFSRPCAICEAPITAANPEPWGAGAGCEACQGGAKHCR